MLRVGLTGGIGSGKSTVCNIFSELGVPVIDADAISHKLVKKGKPALKYIKDVFGDKVFNGNGELDRNKMREIIFNDTKSRKQLENILHPLIYNEIERRLSDLINPYCVICIPLLLETGSENKVDRILVIDIPEEMQVNRTVLRDNSNVIDIKKIIDSQVSRKERLKAADDVIVNDGDLTDLKNKIHELNNKYNRLSAEPESNYTDIN